MRQVWDCLPHSNPLLRMKPRVETTWGELSQYTESSPIKWVWLYALNPPCGIGIGGKGDRYLYALNALKFPILK